MSLKAYVDSGLTIEAGKVERLTQVDAQDPGDYKLYQPQIYTEYGVIDVVYKHTAGGFVELKKDVDYTIVPEQLGILLTATLGPTEHLLVVPPSRLMLGFSGTIGEAKTASKAIFVAKTGVWSYANVHVFSERMEELAPFELYAETITFTLEGGFSKGTGFTALVPASVIGTAVFVNGAYIGLVTAATVDSITTDNTTFTGADKSVQLFEVGDLMFAPDNTGAPGTFSKVLALGSLLSSTPVKVWVQGSATIPATPVRSPEDAIVVAGIEYFA